MSAGVKRHQYQLKCVRLMNLGQANPAGALRQCRRTGAFSLPPSEDDWTHTREHRGALGGVIAQVADMPIG